MRARIARLIVDRMLDQFPVRAVYPDGTVRGRGGPVLEIVRPTAMFERLARSPKVGLGEAYQAGDWRAGDGTDLAELLTPFAARVAQLVPRPLLTFRRLVEQRLPSRQRNTPAGARSNIRAHYDLSNALFGAFLDPGMTYSSALFDHSDEDLEAAQHRKVERILDQAEVGAGTRLLEIGIGWGTLAIAAARRGARVTGITLST
ncbi:MAG TPA: class I SAM-dependent methyltransferase, partial [Kribbella sp.]